MMTTRKEFLAVSAVGSVFPSSSLIAAASDQIPKLSFDAQRFRRAVSRPAAHRHLFAAASVGRGSVLSAMQNTFQSYEDSFNTPASRILEVGILYHGMAVTLALGDRAWSQLILPALSRLPVDMSDDIRTLRVEPGNPILRTGPNGRVEQSLTALVAKGAEFFVCYSALAGLAVALGQTLNRHAGDVYSEMTGSLVHGAMLVPTGVWAIHALQEAHFTLLQTSL